MYPMFLRIVLVLASVVVSVGEGSADTEYSSIDGTFVQTAPVGDLGPLSANFGTGARFLNGADVKTAGPYRTEAHQAVYAIWPVFKQMMFEQYR